MKRKTGEGSKNQSEKDKNFVRFLMETSEINNNTNNKRAIRPASILLQNKDTGLDTSDTKGIINWKFTLSTKTATDHAFLKPLPINTNQQYNTYLKFYDVNYQSDCSKVSQTFLLLKVKF